MKILKWLRYIGKLNLPLRGESEGRVNWNANVRWIVSKVPRWVNKSCVRVLERNPDIIEFNQVMNIRESSRYLSLAGHLCAHQPMASYLYLRSKPSSMETAASLSVVLYSGISYHPPFMIAQFLSRPSRNGWKLVYFSANIMGSKTACTLESACILRRNIKCSVIIIIIRTNVSSLLN